MVAVFNKFKETHFYYSFSKDRLAQVSALIFVIMALLAIFAPFIAPTNPYDLATVDIMNSDIPPAWMEGGDSRFLFGTDIQGRDVWSSILYGMRVSITIGICAVMLQVFLGVTVGLLSGYAGGKLDSFFMRMADIQLSFSTMMVAIIVIVIFQQMFGGESYSKYAIYILIFVIGVSEWPQYARTVRASVLAEKKKEYVDAAKVIGLSHLIIMFRHILPNVLSPIFVISTVQVANAIISEAALSFLGLGMPVTQPSLGSLISIGFHYIFSGSWWITFIPGIFLVLLVLWINLFGDWLRDTFNPKLYKY